MRPSFVRQVLREMIVAFQFLTRIPMPSIPFGATSLSSSIRFFPFIGLVIGASAALLQHVLLPHLPRPIVAFALVLYLVLLTGCLHEDGLADTADGFGGGWSKEQILAIMKDSRIGSYGATALFLSLLARYLMLALLPLEHFTAYLISAHVLCRWTSLPLGYFLPAARQNDGQGAQIASMTSLSSLIFGSIFSAAVVILALRWSAVKPILTALIAVVLSGWIYSKKIGGVTGDCFGATTQLTEVAVYLCGEWHP